MPSSGTWRPDRLDDLRRAADLPPQVSPANVLILAYHRVNPEAKDGLSVSPAVFGDQLRVLASRGWQNVVLDELVGGGPQELEGRKFAITFDDGYQDNYLHALPVLEELGLRATVYVVTSYIDSDELFPWIDAGNHRASAVEDRHMTSQQMNDAMRRGTFVYGSHTHTHPHLSRLDRGKALAELSESKTILEERFGTEVRTFCYPAGDFNEETPDIVRQAGYAAAVVTPNRYIPETMFTLHRVGVYRNINPGLFRLKTHGSFARLQKTRAFWWLRRWRSVEAGMRRILAGSG